MGKISESEEPNQTRFETYTKDKLKLINYSNRSESLIVRKLDLNLVQTKIFCGLFQKRFYIHILIQLFYSDFGFLEFEI